MTCEICGLDGPEERHPCRFEIACSCWYGFACKGTGRVKTEQRHTRTRIR